MPSVRYELRQRKNERALLLAALPWEVARIEDDCIIYVLARFFESSHAERYLQWIRGLERTKVKVARLALSRHRKRQPKEASNER